MDALVLAWVALRKGASIPRRFVPAADRNSLERACNGAEQNFMKAREHVRACSTFQSLASRDQERIAAVLFELKLPTG
jgi:hypothetical protein